MTDVIGWIAVAVGTVVLIGGWIMEHPNVTTAFVPMGASMKPLTASTFIAAGVGMTARAEWLRRLAGLTAFVVGVSSLGYWVFGWPPMWHRLVDTQPMAPVPGVMSPQAAMAFALLGPALMLPYGPARGALCVGVVVIGVSGAIGYALGYAELMQWMPSVNGIALHTSLLFILLGVGGVLRGGMNVNG